MLHSLVLVCLLSFVSGRMVTHQSPLASQAENEHVKDNDRHHLKDFDINIMPLNFAIMEHTKELLEEILSESSLSGEIRFEECKMFGFGEVTKKYRACKEKCRKKKSMFQRMYCKTGNFHRYLSTCFSDTMECFDDNDEHEDAEICSNWSYPSNNWPNICPNYCDGEIQSPINIDMTDPHIEFEEITYNYKPSISTVNIKNNGHSVIISWDTSINTPSISGGGLGADYTLAQFHFHWGCENTRGSEHTVDGKSFAVEMHLVHYKTSYGNLGEAIKYSDGLAVLGVFFIVGAENLALKPITDNLSQITDPGTEKAMEINVALEDFLPSNKQTFYRYLGSLTTPTCNEVVVWSVFTDHVELSQAQVVAFRSLKDNHNAYLCNNYREVQPKNARSIALFNAYGILRREHPSNILANS